MTQNKHSYGQHLLKIHYFVLFSNWEFLVISCSCECDTQIYRNTVCELFIKAFRYSPKTKKFSWFLCRRGNRIVWGQVLHKCKLLLLMSDGYGFAPCLISFSFLHSGNQIRTKCDVWSLRHSSYLYSQPGLVLLYMFFAFPLTPKPKYLLSSLPFFRLKMGTSSASRKDPSHATSIYTLLLNCSSNMFINWR